MAEAFRSNGPGDNMIDKAFLRQHLERMKEYQQEMQRLEQFNDSSLIRSPADNDGMPHASGDYSDNTALWVMRKELLEKNVSDLQRTLHESELQIENVIRGFNKANEKTVIRLRYINGLSWEEVAFFVFGDKSDYCDRVEHYKTKVQKIHGAALKNMLRLQENIS